MRISVLYTVALFGLVAILRGDVKNLSIDHAVQTIEIKPGQDRIEGTFILKNPGDQRIQIERITASCGCAQYHLGKQFLDAGEETPLTLTVNVGGRTSSFTIMATIAIEGQSSAAVVRLNLHIPESFAIRPRLLTWSVGSRAVAKRALIVRGPGGPATTSVTGVQTNDEGFEARLLPAEKEGDYWIEVTPKNTDKAQGVVYRVVLDPAGSNQEALTIYAYIK